MFLPAGIERSLSIIRRAVIHFEGDAIASLDGAGGGTGVVGIMPMLIGNMAAVAWGGVFDLWHRTLLIAAGQV